MKFSGKKGILRTKNVLNMLNNPQEKIKVIHIAGTSGKGSTSFLLSKMLRSVGFKVGLQISPHLLDIRERFQINNNLISEEEFTQIFNEIYPIIKKSEQTEWGRLTYFEILVAVSFYIFHKLKVDYTVIETGLGGLYDGTNVIDNPSKVCIITQIGFDHQFILGNTLKEIASQKAGIIHQGNAVFVIKQGSEVDTVFSSQVKEKKANLYLLQRNKNFKNISISEEGTSFTFLFDEQSINTIYLKLIGDYQAENSSLALATIIFLSKRDSFVFDVPAIKKVLAESSYIGRFEIRKNDKGTIIIDGAHNPQKMESFISNLVELYPHEKFNFLIAFSPEKDHKQMLESIIPYANKIYVTDFFIPANDLKRQSADPLKIKEILNSLNYNNYTIVDNKNINFAEIIERNHSLVITGSLYLISTIYNRVTNF